MTILQNSTNATNAAATEGHVKSFLTNMRTFIADFLGSDSDNKQAAQAALQTPMHGSLPKSSGYTITAVDRGKVITASAALTLNVTTAAELGDGFVFGVWAKGGAVIIDPSASEQINGLPIKAVNPGEFLIIYCDGYSFSTVGGSSYTAGFISPYAGSTAPNGWLFCYGQAVSRTEYSSLFSVIGVAYGSGNGATTFNVPDLRGRAIAGRDDMGGVSAGRMSSIADSTNLGATGNEGKTAILSSAPGYSYMYSQPVSITNFLIKT